MLKPVHFGYPILIRYVIRWQLADWLVMYLVVTQVGWLLFNVFHHLGQHSSDRQKPGDGKQLTLFERDHICAHQQSFDKPVGLHDHTEAAYTGTEPEASDHELHTLCILLSSNDVNTQAKIVDTFPPSYN